MRAAVVEGLEVIAVESLAQTVAFFAGEIDIAPTPSRIDELFERFSCYDIEFGGCARTGISQASDDVGRRRKTQPADARSARQWKDDGSAKRMPTILPQLNPLESIETTRIYSALGQLPAAQPLLARRPFRSPHHTISDAGLVGGGNPPSPGEISKAHNGILFLDELPEFNRKTLEVMRQPLEDSVVTISRAMRSTTFPADFVLIAAANPCPCGYRSDPRRNCNCTPPQIEKYMGKISGPLLDRIDIHIEVPSVPFEELSSSSHQGTSSEQMREDVVRARDAQSDRFGDDTSLGPSVRYNAQMTSRQVRKFCHLSKGCQQMLRHSVEEMGLSARAHDKILRVARTIADVAKDQDINESHLAEAIGYRSLDRELWI